MAYDIGGMVHDTKQMQTVHVEQSESDFKPTGYVRVIGGRVFTNIAEPGTTCVCPRCGNQHRREFDAQ